MPKVKITGLPQMKSGGYTVKRSNARKGKTHVVIGPDGTKKYFGDPKMGEKGKSKHGKEAFYARHAKNLKGNPYFRAYARATWADGGMVDMYEGGGDVPTPMYNPSVPEVSIFDLTKQAMGGLIYKLGGPIKAGEGYVQNELSEGFAEGGRYATSDSPVPQRTSGLMNYLGYGQTRPFAMGGYKMYFDGGPGDPGDPPVRNVSDRQIISGNNAQNIARNTNEFLQAHQGSGDVNYDMINPGRKMNPSEWNSYMTSKGYKRANIDQDPALISTSTNYYDYYDPAKYALGKTGFWRVEDLNKPSVNYEGDATYKPFMKYQSPNINSQGTNVTTRVRQNQPKTPTYTAPDLTSQGYTEIPELNYMSQQDNPAFKDLQYESIPSGTQGVMRRFQKVREGSPSWQKMQPGYTPGMATKAMGGYMYAQGGSKLPEPILRARLESHMSPEEADNYISNYASGGNTGTGILGNMTFNPSPWKYVEGGQLGPYPYSGYKSDLSEFKKGGIHIKPENRGKFTASAKKAGMGVQEYARHVLANKENYSPTLVKRANFARNAAKWQHAYGGYQVPQYYPGGPTDRPSPLVRNMMADLDRQQEKQFEEQTGQNMWDYYSTINQPVVIPERPAVSFNPAMDNNALNLTGSSGVNWQSPALKPVDTSSDYADALAQLRKEVATTKIPKVSGPLGPINMPDMDVTDPGLVDVQKYDIKKKGVKSPKGSTDLYYPSQWAQQAAAPLAYLGAEGKRYDQAIRRTYNPELYSARMPLMAIDEAGRAAAMDLAARNTGVGNYMANRIALANKLGMSKAQTREGIDKTNVDIRNDAGYKNLAMQTSYDEQDARNKAQAITNYYKTLNQLGTVGATTGKDMRSEQMDKFKWQYLPEIYKAMALDPELMKKYKEGLGI